MTRVEPDIEPTGEFWPLATVAMLDVETTGVDPEQDRLVSVYVGSIVDGIEHSGRAWLIDPGVPIPKAATEVHGITNEQAEADGNPPDSAIADILRVLQDLVDAALPVVVYNAPFDLTMLHREAVRHLGPEAGGRVVELYEDMVVLDPLVIDKAIDRYRSGSRRLGDVAEHYGVTVDREKLHGAAADASIAGHLMLAIWRHPKLLGYPASHLHDRSIDHAREQAASFADYLHSRGRHDEAVEVERHAGAWPWRPPTDHHDYHHRGETR